MNNTEIEEKVRSLVLGNQAVSNKELEQSNSHQHEIIRKKYKESIDYLVKQELYMKIKSQRSE